VDDAAHGSPPRVTLHTLPSVAKLDEFKLASPDVHVVYRLASEAVQLRGVSRYAHGLYMSQLSCVEKHSWLA